MVMSRSLVVFQVTLLLLLAFSKVGNTANTLSSNTALTEVTRAPWSAGLVSLNLGSRFFWGASALRNFGSSWAGGVKAGTATLDFTQNQSFLSGFGRWHYPTNSFFLEGGLSTISGFTSGSQLFGLAAGTQISLTRNWTAEVAVGYEGIDRLVLRSPFSSWSTARIQVGLIRDL